MLLPEEDSSTYYIMVATRMGIGPYRGFIRCLFVEYINLDKAYKWQVWLFLGVTNSDALLYDDKFQEATAGVLTLLFKIEHHGCHAV